MSESITETRRDLAAALRLAEREGLHEGVCNHFSVAVPAAEGGAFLVNPNRVHWSQVTASGLLLIDDDGAVLEGEGEPEATAFFIHWRLHRAAPQARCVLHTHMPYATALACLDDPTLLPVSQSALIFLDDVAYDVRYNGLALDAREGDRICRALGDKSVLFLANHGVIVVGASVAEAYMKLYYLERACMHQVMGAWTGAPPRLINPAVARETRRIIAEDREMAPAYLSAMRGVLDRVAPDYRD